MHAHTSLFALVALALSACPPLENPTPADGGANDAGVGPDAGASDAGLELDFRQTRGAPWTLHDGVVISGAPFALSEDRFVVQTGCDGGACDYEWRDASGALLNRRENLRGLFSNDVARSGRVASLYEVRTTGSCVDSLGGTHPWFEGAWHLLDVTTGDSLATISSITSHAFLDSAFLRAGLHARLLPADTTGCSYTPLLRATSVPFGSPPAQAHLDAASWVEDELSDGRVLISGAPETLFVVDPRAATTRTVVSTQATTILVTEGYAHAFERQPVRAVASYDAAAQRTVRTELPWTQRDFLVRAVSGRFFVTCGPSQPVTACEVRDGRGELPASELAVSRVNGLLPFAIAGEAGIVLWVHAGVVWRRNLFTGEQAVVHEGAAALRAVGNGRGVLLTTPTRAVAIDATRARELPGRFVTALDTASLGASADLPQAQTVLVIGTSESGGENWLTAWHVPSGRVARLTDALDFNPPFDAPLTAATRCEGPGFVRSAGEPLESAFVETALLHFTEFVAQEHPVLRVFVMPLDLSAAPRLVAETAPDACGTPLATPDGAKLWLPVPIAGTDRVKTTWAAP